MLDERDGERIVDEELEHLAVLQADDEALAAGGAAEHLGVADGGVELPLALALAAGGVEAQLLVVA